MLLQANELLTQKKEDKIGKLSPTMTSQLQFSFQSFTLSLFLRKIVSLKNFKSHNLRSSLVRRRLIYPSRTRAHRW